jgi:hypothetical protein
MRRVTVAVVSGNMGRIMACMHVVHRSIPIR